MESRTPYVASSRVKTCASDHGNRLYVYVQSPCRGGGAARGGRRVPHERPWNPTLIWGRRLTSWGSTVRGGPDEPPTLVWAQRPTLFPHAAWGAPTSPVPQPWGCDRLVASRMALEVLGRRGGGRRGVFDDDQRRSLRMQGAWLARHTARRGWSPHLPTHAGVPAGAARPLPFRGRFVGSPDDLSPGRSPWGDGERPGAPAGGAACRLTGSGVTNLPDPAYLRWKGLGLTSTGAPR